MLWFEQCSGAFAELEEILRREYPTLHAFKADGLVTVEGTYAVYDAGAVIDRYCLALKLPDNYPHDLPEVREIAGRIPNLIDRHVFPSGTLCLGVREELWIALGGNFSVARVLDGPIRSFLIGNSLVEQSEPWPAGERPHGVPGMLEFYEGYLGAREPLALGKFLTALCQDKVRGHWACPCGSGAIIRNCHTDAVQTLRAVPKDVLSHTVMTILDWLNANGSVTIRRKRPRWHGTTRERV